MRSISITSSSTSARYVDRKGWAWALSPVWICMPLMGIGLASATGAGAWNWLTLIVWYLVLPLADFIVGTDTNNPPESALEQLDQAPYYRILTAAATEPRSRRAKTSADRAQGTIVQPGAKRRAASWLNEPASPWIATFMPAA